MKVKSNYLIYILQLPFKRNLMMYVLLAILFSVNATAQEFQRKEYNFNLDWKLKKGDFKGAENPKFNENNWKEVTLPPCYNQEEARISQCHRPIANCRN